MSFGGGGRCLEEPLRSDNVGFSPQKLRPPDCGAHASEKATKPESGRCNWNCVHDFLFTHKKTRAGRTGGQSHKTHATIEVYLFLAKMFSEWRGLLNPTEIVGKKNK